MCKLVVKLHKCTKQSHRFSSSPSSSKIHTDATPRTSIFILVNSTSIHQTDMSFKLVLWIKWQPNPNPCRSRQAGCPTLQGRRQLELSVEQEDIYIIAGVSLSGPDLGHVAPGWGLGSDRMARSGLHHSGQSAHGGPLPLSCSALLLPSPYPTKPLPARGSLPPNPCSIAGTAFLSTLRGASMPYEHA